MHWIQPAFAMSLSIAGAVVLVRGDRHDRLVAAAEIIACAATLFARTFETSRFRALSPSVTAIDLALLLAVAAAAVRTRRPWIIATASLLVFPPLGHFAKMVRPKLWTGGYWLMTNAPAMLWLVVIGVRAFSLMHRRRNAPGTC